jgi:hypothetical protein
MTFKKSEKQANARHPQVVTLIIDDSGSMAEEGKCQQVTEAVQDMVITMQSLNMGTHGYRFLLNICKFGDFVTDLAVAKSPPEVDVDALKFEGGSGGTEMLLALQWADSAVKKALERCRAIPNYQEDKAPNPVCIFLSDGESTGEDFRPAANALRSISFKNGEIDVLAAGVGMKDEHFENMKAIASRPEYAIRIDSEGVAEFLGDVGGTVVEGTDIARLASKAR